MKKPWILRDEACIEGYEYFDKNIRKLPRKSDGTFNEADGAFQSNDVDAFRHAYVSGVFTMEYSELAADVLGRLNEYHPGDIYSNSRDPRSMNMDLWNNGVGRKYGKKAKERKKLLRLIHQSLIDGELIIELKDERQYHGDKHDPIGDNKHVIVLVEDKNGRNVVYFDIANLKILSADDFIVQIQAGLYPRYTIKTLKGRQTPVSKPDKIKNNNLT
jgi:hypothetical protein